MNNLVLAPRFTPSSKPLGDLYLKFQLNREISAVFSMDQVHEVLVISLDQITPLPNMPACVLGLLTRRSRVMWLVDLAHLLLCESLVNDHAASSQRYSVVIVRVEQTWPHNHHSTLPVAPQRALLGLIVDEIKGSIRLENSSIQAPQGHSSPSLAPCLRGSVFHAGKLLLVLDTNAIAHSLNLQAS